MESIPYSEVRAHLAETLKKLEVREEPVYISRRGEPAAVLMSVVQYQRLKGAHPDFHSALMAWRERHAAELAAADTAGWQDPYAKVRDRDPDGGRPAIDFTALSSPDAGRAARPAKAVKSRRGAHR